MKPIEDSKAARLELQFKAKNKVKKNKENIAPSATAEVSKENTAPVVNVLQPKQKAQSPTKVLDNFFRPSPTKAIKRKADEMDQSPSDQTGPSQPAVKKPRKITPTLITAYAPSLQAQNTLTTNSSIIAQSHLQAAPTVSDSVNSESIAKPADRVVTVAQTAEPIVPAPIAIENMTA